MGIFGSLFGKSGNSGKGGFSYILELAKLLTDNETVRANLKSALDNPDKYFSENEWRYAERGVVVGKTDRKTLYWLALVDELAEGGIVFEVDYKCELEEFLGALERLNNYGLIESAVGSLDLPEDGDVEVWGEELNRALGEKAFVCCIDIDSDSYPLVIVSGDVLEKIQKLAGDNDRKIENL
ncbi:MAG: hypothetical protein K2N38_13495 [Oscillospiraceae bacterium]|nr:hypothetical protein [Oscillospiraceae bacterium]